ncbi:MAG: alpha/beta hydrolase [Clostridia bacterium]|nr:alpha/beta hydrolase [Clostridia bacterium]
MRNNDGLIKTYNRNGIETDYFFFGHGSKTMVIIPGLSLKSVMQSAPAVIKAYEEFTDDYTVYVIDRRKNASAGYSVRDAAKDTAQLLMSLGIDGAYFFGTSFGGMVSQQIAVDYPSLVKKLIIASSMSRASAAGADKLKKWVEYAAKHDVASLNREIVNSIYSASFLEKYAGAFRMFENDGTAEECDLFCVYARAAAEFDIYDSLDSIKCPVLVIGAYGDKVLGGEASVETAKKLGCECYMYGEEFSHAVYDEAPDYKQRIMDFFEN